MNGPSLLWSKSATNKNTFYRAGDEMCSGNGDCVCGNCTCFENWSGSDCSCYENEASCLSPYNEQTCSGFGSCLCSRCKCNPDLTNSGSYTGEYCERGPNEAYPCSILRDCVECQAFESGPLKEKCIESCFFELEEIFPENATSAYGVDEKCSFENTAGKNIFVLFWSPLVRRHLF